MSDTTAPHASAAMPASDGGPASLRMLDNVFWHALSDSQRSWSDGGSRARRYRRGIAPVLALDDLDDPDFSDLVPHCEPGEQIYVDGWAGPVPEGWRLEREASMYKMVWRGDPAPELAPTAAVALGPTHAASMLELAEMTRPGPFGPGNLQLGEYLGTFEDGRLVAMAGERAFVRGFRELSAICTRPGYTRRGLAAALTCELIRRALARGEIPFLHVVTTNDAAVALYRRLGFDVYRASPVRIVSRIG